MDPLPRRRLLAVGGIAALAGCSGNLLSDDGQPTDTPTDDPSGDGSPSQAEFESVLEAIPETVGDQDVQQVQLVEPLSTDESETSMARVRSRISENFGVDSSDVDHVGVGIYDSSYTSIGVVVGSFDADDPSLPESHAASAVHRDEGLFVAAITEEQEAWTDGIDAAESALSEGTNSLAANETVYRVLEPLVDVGIVSLYPTFPPETQSTTHEEVEGLEVAAIGRSLASGDRHELHGVFLFEDESTAAETAPEDLPTFASTLEDADPTVQRDGRLLTVSATVERTNSGGGTTTEHDFYFFARYDGETGQVILSHGGSESVDADALTVFVEDEPIDNPWESETVAEGTTARFEAPPFSAIRVEYDDPESGEPVTVSRRVARIPDAFEGTYDPDADTVTFEYTGRRSASTAHLRIQTMAEDEHPGQDGESRRPDADRLEPGDEIVVEDVPYGRTVVLVTELEWETGSQSASVAHVSTAPPGEFTLESSPTELVYQGRAQPATNYRVTVAGEPAQTQLDEEYSTLTDGDRLSVSGEPGTEIAVEWTGEDGPVEVFSSRVRPQATFELTRRPETFELTYTGDTEWDSAAFEIVSGDDDASFESEYDTLTTGDSIEIDPDDLWGLVLVNWVDDETSITVFRKSLTQLADFELESTSGGAQLTFTGRGEWPAEEFDVAVAEESIGAALADEYETVEAGDSVTIDGAVGDSVVVRWTRGDSSMAIFGGHIHPAFAFDFQYDADADELTITSRVEHGIDPSTLTVRVFSETGFEQRDTWQADHDSVEAGDSITIDTPESLTGVDVAHEGWGAVASFEP